MFLKSTPIHAFKEFVFKDPDSGREFTGQSIADLCKQVRSYRNQNELDEIDYLEAVIENYLCRRPKNYGGCEPMGPFKRGVWPTIRGGIVLLQNLMYKKFVTQAVADERAEVCKGCTLNIFPDRDAFVEWSDELAVASVGDRRSKWHDDLGNCGGCSCPLRCKVWYGGKIKLSTKEKEAMSINKECWQLKES